MVCTWGCMGCQLRDAHHGESMVDVGAWWMHWGPGWVHGGVATCAGTQGFIMVQVRQMNPKDEEPEDGGDGGAGELGQGDYARGGHWEGSICPER